MEYKEIDEPWKQEQIIIFVFVPLFSDATAG
jgi:hypothetical protein